MESWQIFSPLDTRSMSVLLQTQMDTSQNNSPASALLRILYVLYSAIFLSGLDII